MVLVSSVAALAMVVAMATARQHRLDASADLAAVSGADGLQRGASACSIAARVAEANGAGLADCRVDGADVVVTVDDRLHLPLGVDERLVSYARAGPAGVMPP
jgi:secretion/DNA translocation related TadE-like protein